MPEEVTPKPGDWVRYLDEYEREVISCVTRIGQAGVVHTIGTGNYWIAPTDILEIRPQPKETR